MSTPNDGGPAFPRDHRHEGHNGMTLRDWFAGQALAGWLASYGPDIPHPAIKETALSALVAEAYLTADAMLAARSKGGAA